MWAPRTAARRPRRHAPRLCPVSCHARQLFLCLCCTSPLQLHVLAWQVAINWTLCKGAIPIPGAKNAKQAREAAGALGWRLTEDEVRPWHGS